MVSQPMKRRSSALCLLASVTALATAMVAGTDAEAKSPSRQAVQAIVDKYADWAFQTGRAVGVAVAVVFGDQKTMYFSYGRSHVAHGAEPDRPVDNKTLFYIASNTKVFTTNVLAQLALEKQLSLTDTLQTFRDKLGPIKGSTMLGLKKQVTLEQLGSFSAGFLDTPAPCGAGERPNKTGCIPPHPNYYAPISEYGAKPFLTSFRVQPLLNWQSTKDPTPRIHSLPAPYLYSNFSTALIGLLLGTPDGKVISNKSVDGWFDLVQDRILTPLGLHDTFLEVPAEHADRLAQGYDRAYATAVVSEDGSITGIDVQDGGTAYRTPPKVTISGGGGSGASATALLSKGSVGSIGVVNGGSGYVAPPKIYFEDPDTHQRWFAGAQAMISGGHITAIVLAPWWTLPDGVHVVIEGGRRDDTLPRATAVARRTGDGNIQFIEVTSGGEGYVDPLTVDIAPGDIVATPLSIFAPAGWLKSSIKDMGRFVRAAMGAQVVDGEPVPPVLTRAFKVAQTPRVCNFGPPALEGCDLTDGQTGLAWQVFPSSATNPTVFTKNGALDGYTSQIMVAPQMRLGVVALTTSDGNSYTGDILADAIFFDLYFRCLDDVNACPLAP